MYSDYHIHTGHSGDTQFADRVQVAAAIACGLDEICLTEHYDIDFHVAPHYDFVADLEGYWHAFQMLREEFGDRIRLKFGLEAGMQLHTLDRTREAMQPFEFDFVLASRHVFDTSGIPAGSGTQWPDYTTMDRAAIMAGHLRQTTECIRAFDNFNCIAHMTYFSRYLPVPHEMLYSDAPDEADELFRLLISMGKGIEINSNGYHEKGFFVPGYSLVKRFRELGGEVLSIGSDAHRPQDVGRGIKEAASMAKEAGFKYVCTFDRMKPVFNPIDGYC